MGGYDLVVIGSGPAGEKGAAQAAWFGKRVALVERQRVLGGACVNTGTIPSKTLREAALQLTGFKQRQLFGIDLQLRPDVTLAELMDRKKDVIAREWERIEENLERHRVERFEGDARFLSDHRIEVVSENGETKVLEGEVILIATGSSPMRPKNFPFVDHLIYDSDTILNLDRIPRSLAVIGAGVIGCEYASIFGALGTRISLIDGRTALLGHMDREIVDSLLSAMRSRFDLELLLGTGVAAVSTAEDEVTMQLTNGREIIAEKVLVAAGRSSNTGTLALDAAGVVTGARGLIPVNDKYQTNVANIYAAGDVIGFPALASTSMEQARVAMVHAFDLKYKTRMSTNLPYGIYTIPEVSSIGITEEQAAAAGIDYAVGRAHYRGNARGQIIGDEEGIVKLVFDAGTLRLLGVHIVGENATELLHVGMMVMQFEGTINAFIESVFNFPTLGDAYKYAAYDGLGNVARSNVLKTAGG